MDWKTQSLHHNQLELVWHRKDRLFSTKMLSVRSTTIILDHWINISIVFTTLARVVGDTAYSTHRHRLRHAPLSPFNSRYQVLALGSGRVAPLHHLAPDPPYGLFLALTSPELLLHPLIPVISFFLSKAVFFFFPGPLLQVLLQQGTMNPALANIHKQSIQTAAGGIKPSLMSGLWHAGARRDATREDKSTMSSKLPLVSIADYSPSSSFRYPSARGLALLKAVR